MEREVRYFACGLYTIVGCQWMYTAASDCWFCTLEGSHIAGAPWMTFATPSRAPKVKQLRRCTVAAVRHMAWRMAVLSLPVLSRS